MPWGNMTMLSDPCQHWAVFKMLDTKDPQPSAQISILITDQEKKLYCCQSIRSKDAAGNPHVLCTGIDLVPALLAQGIDAANTINLIEEQCNKNNGAGNIPDNIKMQLESISKILNIGWIAEGADNEATIICSRSSSCPRKKHCLGAQPKTKLISQLDRIRESLVV